MSDYIDFDPPENPEDVQADVAAFAGRISSLNARAVMPGGHIMDRGAILATLGLNPNTAPTAWLAVVACGSNASALLPGDLQQIAATRLSAVSKVISTVSKVESLSGGGFVSGGAMRDIPKEK